MRLHVHKVFDEFVPNGVSPVNTSTELNDNLGLFSQIGIQAIVENVSAASSFDLWIEQSADSRNWVIRNGSAGTAGTGDISIATLSTNGVNTKFYSAACRGTSFISGSPTFTGPLLPFVRLRISLGGSIAAQVRVIVVHRGGRAH